MSKPEQVSIVYMEADATYSRPAHYDVVYAPRVNCLLYVTYDSTKDAQKSLSIDSIDQMRIDNGCIEIRARLARWLVCMYAAKHLERHVLLS